MKKKSVRDSPVKKIYLTIALIIIIISLFYFAGIFKKTCLNEECFNKSLKVCKPTDYMKQKNNNLYLYSISRSFGRECNLEIDLKKVAPGTDPDMKELLEGKSMQCSIPKTITRSLEIDDIDVLSYCHGELKEGIYELIIKKMYSLIVGNLEEIRDVTEEVLAEI